MTDIIRIDGAFGEGGGQIIRTSLALAALTGREVEIENIRANRSKPGLQAQHATAVRAAGAICHAEMQGAVQGSTWLGFRPRQPVRADRYTFEIGTAGATPLVAQTVLVPLALAPGVSEVQITGGTHVPHAPAREFLAGAYVPMLRAAGLEATLSSPAIGFYPRGGGELHLRIGDGEGLQALDWTERGKLKKLTAHVVTARLPDHVGERGAEAVRKATRAWGREAGVLVEDLPSAGAGAAVTVLAECEHGTVGFTALGERGKPMEQVAQDAVAAFAAWHASGAAVDEHLADQLVLPLALAAGESRWTTERVSEHLRTVLWVARQFLPIDYDITERPDGTGLIRLRGAG